MCPVMSVAAEDRDIWIGLEYMLCDPQNWQFGHLLSVKILKTYHELA